MTWKKPTASTTARGYGGQHQNLRKQWAPRIAAGTVNCWRCGRRIQPWMDWELGHDDWNRSITRGPEHKTCNRRAAARKAKVIRTAGKRKRVAVIDDSRLKIMDDSRVW